MFNASGPRTAALVLAGILTAAILSLTTACGGGSGNYDACKAGMEHSLAEGVATNGSSAPDPAAISACKGLSTAQLQEIARTAMAAQFSNLSGAAAGSPSPEPSALVKPAGCPQILSDVNTWESASSDDISTAAEFPSKVQADEAYAYPQLKSDEATLASDFDAEFNAILGGDSSATFDGAVADVQTVMADCG